MKVMILVMVMASAALAAGDIHNPFFSEYDTPFGVAPFDSIKDEHFLPAFKEGIEQQKQEIDAIVKNSKPATFENTIEAMEFSGRLITKVGGVFRNLMSADTNDKLQEIAREVSPMMSEHQDDIRLNEKLFERVKAVYQKKDTLNLTTEQSKLLEERYKSFVRGGANLNDTDKEKLRTINTRLSLLTLNFEENLLEENKAFVFVIDKKSDLEGLPDGVIAGAADAAAEKGHQGKWLFTLDKPSLIPFLQYSQKRNLREKMFKGYITRGNHNNELDNKDILAEMVSLRVKRAKLLGYKTHAHYVLAENMAKEPQHVYDLLERLWDPALKIAKKEAYDLQSMIFAQGDNFRLEPWDWWYYTEKLRKAKYDLDDEILKPYFKLENVRNGAFNVATKLYGITFEEITDIPKYHDEVTVFEVKEADGTHIGLLYTDYHPRAGKRGGAWMSAYRKQSRKDGKKVTPILSNVCNFSRPSGDKPALLSFDEVTTLFHEFGHALHGLLADCTYESLSGTSVVRDFVELPSQIMENWASEPDVLRSYAKHYKTGEPIPQALIDEIQKARHFNQGFVVVEYLAASFLDMDWHTIEKAGKIDPVAFEMKSLDKIGLIPEIVSRYRSTYFRHIFAGGYSSGYYGYIWAQVLDADAFQAFKETSLFDRKTADAFRRNILEAGGTEDPQVLYKRFRGSEPKIEPLLERIGLK